MLEFLRSIFYSCELIVRLESIILVDWKDTFTIANV